MKKYPNLDYDLEVQSMQEWIENNYAKAKKYHVWNLFIQRWLSRARPAWKSYYNKTTTADEIKIAEHWKKIIKENPDSPFIDIYEIKLKEYEDKYGELED